MLKIVILLSCVLCALADGHQDVGVDPPPHSPFPIIPTSSTSTTIAPPTNATTPKSTTTTKATTTSTSTTTPPTTKSTTPSSTTTSTPASTTSTTPASTTRTTPSPKPSPTPSPAPEPVGPPAVNNFTGNYTNSKNICLMMKMALQVELLDKTSTKINVTDKVTYSVTCPNATNATHESLDLYWGNNNLTILFFKNNTVYEIENVTVALVLPGDNKTTYYYHKKPEFSVSTKQSYKCAKDQPLNLTGSDSKSTLAQLHVSNLQYQAFMNTTKPQYDSAWYCDATNTGDVVPIVVGCVLAVLVVLVLVAYLFGRRRCQARGYLSISDDAN